jgi:hypothetical protein
MPFSIEFLNLPPAREEDKSAVDTLELPVSISESGEIRSVEASFTTKPIYGFSIINGTEPMFMVGADVDNQPEPLAAEPPASYYHRPKVTAEQHRAILVAKTKKLMK